MNANVSVITISEKDKKKPVEINQLACVLRPVAFNILKHLFKKGSSIKQIQDDMNRIKIRVESFTVNLLEYAGGWDTIAIYLEFVLTSI